MEIIEVSELPEDAKVSDYHRDNTEYFIMLLVFGRRYYIPVVNKMEKLLGIKDGLVSARKWDLINDMFQVVIASVYYQVRDTVGAEIFEALAKQIEGGFKDFFNDGLSNLIEERFKASEVDRSSCEEDSDLPTSLFLEKEKWYKDCTTCIRVPASCGYFKECSEENNYSMWESPSSVFMEKVKKYSTGKVYFFGEGGSLRGVGRVKGLVPHKDNPDNVVLTVEFLDGSLRNLEEKEVIRVNCSSCRKLAVCNEALGCLSDGFKYWDVKETCIGGWKTRTFENMAKAEKVVRDVKERKKGKNKRVRTKS